VREKVSRGLSLVKMSGGGYTMRKLRLFRVIPRIYIHVVVHFVHMESFRRLFVANTDGECKNMSTGIEMPSHDRSI